ncbi:Rho GTPase-activating protein 23 [Smittium mucronatum]|uniref:Rho GTPase-activating protein 23 n=1 Tax=Smittium mucronatum TaxID=133383 RepID=A0A1R0GN95_9FUNG|nr:Rho GTPase-activating protein 23 [Smittium mucronatum]
MSWSGGWKNAAQISEGDPRASKQNRSKHLSIFGTNLKKNFLTKRDNPSNPSQLPPPMSPKSSWRFGPNSQNTERNSNHYWKSFSNGEKSPQLDSNTPSDRKSSSSRYSIISMDQQTSRNVVIKSGYLSKKSDNMSVTSLSSALGRGWRVYRVVLKGAKLFFYKPPPESELKAIFNVKDSQDLPSVPKSSSSGMPVSPAELETSSRSILFDPVISDGIIQKPLCERYIFGDCFTEVEIKKLKFKRYVCILIFDDKIVILKRKWVREGKTSNFLLSLGNKMKINKKGYNSTVPDDSSLVSTEFGIKGKGYFTKWKSHVIYDIKSVEAVGTISSNNSSTISQSNLNSIDSSRTSMYSVGNQSISSLMTKNSTMSKDYSGMISTGISPGFQIFVSGGHPTTRIFIATSVDSKNNWMARFSVAKASYSRKYRQTIFEETQKSHRWNSNPGMDSNEIRPRTTSRNFENTFGNSSQSPSNNYPKVGFKDNTDFIKTDRPFSHKDLRIADSEISPVDDGSNIVISSDIKNKEFPHFHISQHPDLVVIDGKVIGGTLSALIHESIFTCVSDISSNSTFTISFSTIYDKFTSTDLFLNSFERISSLVDPENQNHSVYVRNIANMIFQISKFYIGKYSAHHIDALERIASSKVFPSNSADIDISSLKNKIESMRTQKLPYNDEANTFVFYTKLENDKNLSPALSSLIRGEQFNSRNELNNKSVNIDAPDSNPSCELSKININGLSTSTLLRIKPEDFSKQVYLFHASLSANLSESKIKYFIFNSIKGFKEKLLIPSLLTIGSLSNAEKDKGGIQFKSANTLQTSQNLHPSLLSEYPLKYIPNDILFRVLFFTPNDPHFFSRLIHHHLLVEIPQNLPSRRASVLLHWIKIGEASRVYGDSIMWAAVSIAVTSPPIARLRETWSIIPLSWRSVVASSWVPTLIKYGLNPSVSDFGSDYQIKIKPLVLEVDEKSRFSPLPYYGLIRNSIEKSGDLTSHNISEPVKFTIKQMDGILFSKFDSMFNTFQDALCDFVELEGKLEKTTNTVKNILRSSIIQLGEGVGINENSSPENLNHHDFVNGTLTNILSLDGNNEISVNLDPYQIEFVPEAQFYFKSLSESPMLFVNESVDEENILYDIKYLMTLSLQCEHSVTELYQEMLHLDMIDENAEKNGLSTQIASVRTEDGLRLASSAILPLVCPELVSSTNVLQWISPLKRDNTSNWKTKNSTRRTKTNSPLVVDKSGISNKKDNSAFFLSLKLDKSTDLSDLELKNLSNISSGESKSLRTISTNASSNLNSVSNHNSSQLFFNIGEDSIVPANSTSFKFNTLNNENSEASLDPNLEKLNSRKRSSSIPKKFENYLELTEFPRMSNKDQDSSYSTPFSPSVDYPKAASSYVGNILYSNDWEISFRVLKVQYSQIEQKFFKDFVPDSRRSSTSNKRNSQSFMDPIGSPSLDQPSKPVGFFVRIESASVMNIFKILIEGLDFIGFVYESTNSSDHILINGDLIPSLSMDRTSFLRSFLMTYRQFCLNIDLTRYVSNLLTSDDGSATNKPLLYYNILELLSIWTTQYPEDFLEDLSLISVIENLISLIKSKLESIKSKFSGQLGDSGSLNGYPNDDLKVEEFSDLISSSAKLSDNTGSSFKQLELMEDTFFNGVYQNMNVESFTNIQMIDDLLAKFGNISSPLTCSSLNPLCFSSTDKHLSDCIKVGEALDSSLQEQKLQQKNLLSYPQPSSVDNPTQKFGSVDHFTLDNLTPMEVLSSLNRLVQTHFSRCMPRDWLVSFCLLEVQTRSPLSWYSTKKQVSNSDEDIVISDIFQVLANSGRAPGHLDSIGKRENSTNKYLGNIGISLLSSLGSKANNSNGAQNDSNLISMFPNSIQTLVHIHNVIRSWAIKMITDTKINYTERSQRICFFLYIIHLCRSNSDQSASHAFEEALEIQSSNSQSNNNYSSNDYVSRSNSFSKPHTQSNGGLQKSNNKPSYISRRITGSGANIKINRRFSNRNPTQNKANRYVPSFVERAIASALVSPESRMFVRTWNQIAVLHHITLSTLELILKGVRDWSFDRWFNTQSALVSGESMSNVIDCGDSNVKNPSPSEDFLVPCVGWLLENFISLCYDSPDIIDSEKQLINFSKRQNIYSMLNSCNILSSRCIDVTSLPVLNRIHLEFFVDQVSNNPLNYKLLKMISNEENNIPLYANVPKSDTSQLYNESIPSTSGNFSSASGSFSNGQSFNKSRPLANRVSKNKSTASNTNQSLSGQAINLSSNSRSARSALSPTSPYVNSSHHSNRSTISNPSDSSQSYYYGGSSNNAFGSLSNKYNLNSSSINNQQLSGNRFLNNHFQFPTSPKSAVISLTVPFSKLVQDEQEKRRHESLERLKLEREYREKRNALEKFTNERTKALKKSLKEQIQRNAKNHQLLKMNNLMNMVGSNIDSEEIILSRNSDDATPSIGESSNHPSLSSSLGKNTLIQGINHGNMNDPVGGLSLEKVPTNTSLDLKDSKRILSRVSIMPRGPSLPVAKPANVVNLINSTVSVEKSYTKRDFVFRIVTEEGGQVLLQAPSEPEMSEWISSIREAATEAAARRLTLFVQDSQKKSSISQPLLTDVPPLIELKQFSSQNPDYVHPEPSPQSHSSPFSSTSLGVLSNKFFDLNVNQESDDSTSSSLDKIIISSSQSSTKVDVFGTQQMSNSVTIKKQTKNFGISLNLLMQDPKVIPVVLSKCISEIERRGLNEIGIYRVSGSTLEVSRLKMQLNSNPETTNLGEDAFPDINVISGVLKHFLRELPEPLIPYNLFSGFINAADISDYDERLWAIKDLINTLPERNFTVLKHLIEHLEKVTDYEETNHMYASNLALVFGPSLIHPPPGDTNFYSAMSTLGQAQSIVKNMILQYHWLFDIEEEVGVIPGDFNVGNEPSNHAIL